ncbi:hypothetical protein PENTCL1PPCAC_30850, partial [Pristionchus entomophagus]
RRRTRRINPEEQLFPLPLFHLPRRILSSWLYRRSNPPCRSRHDQGSRLHRLRKRRKVGATRSSE